MNVSWLSAGVSSFIATYLVRDSLDKIIYLHIEEQHPDTLRFVKDCETALDIEIEILTSKYKSVKNVIDQFRFINGPYGAKCTEILKKRVRKEWEYGKKGLSYVWGYDCSKRERKRAIKTFKSMPKQEHVFPLISNNLTKSDCHGILKQLGMKRPAMYDLGYQNNNCIGCVKGGMGYWNKIRVDFPDAFAERAKQEREIGHSCINGIFLDELDPNRGNFENEIMEDCGFVCQMNMG